ncbi:MAG TPA: bifunctional precorrin-2 dehydrogenase/sirohydrochlorin ferrochelatase [Armatimonadota bacterium]|jgi:siroheme synthase-like protein
MSELPEVTTPPPYFPVLLDLRGRRCVVIGGGEVARRKVAALCAAQADVTVVAPHVVAMPAGATVIRRAFLPTDLDDAMLVIAATDSAAVNAQIAAEAECRGIWVNVVDDPARCSLIMPAVVQRGALRIAISTAGASPTLARQLKDELEATYGPEYGDLVQLLWELRRAWEPEANAADIAFARRREIWDAVLRLPLLDLLRGGQRAEAARLARELLTQALAGTG